MQFDLDQLLRRLLLMGVPLLPTSCIGSSCPDEAGPPADRYIEIENPARAGRDGGFSTVTIDAYDRCLATLDCAPLCQQAFPFTNVVSCQRVATDAFAPGDERLALQAKVIYLCEGRRPEGQAAPPPPARARCEVGAFLARAAYLEGVSVPAFRRLARELGAHGAPATLVTAATRAAREEGRHLAVMTRLARRHGAEPAPLPRAFPSAIRPLEAVAAENAAEGCLRETVGALVAREQAGHAGDAAIRAGLRAVARDEAGHANLAFAVAAWAEGRLDAAARVRVADRLTAEVDVLRRQVDAAPVPPALVLAAGHPSQASMQALVAGLAHALM